MLTIEIPNVNKTVALSRISFRQALGQGVEVVADVDRSAARELGLSWSSVRVEWMKDHKDLTLGSTASSVDWRGTGGFDDATDHFLYRLYARQLGKAISDWLELGDKEEQIRFYQRTTGAGDDGAWAFLNHCAGERIQGAAVPGINWDFAIPDRAWFPRLPGTRNIDFLNLIAGYLRTRAPAVEGWVPVNDTIRIVTGNTSKAIPHALTGWRDESASLNGDSLAADAGRRWELLKELPGVDDDALMRALRAFLEAAGATFDWQGSSWPRHAAAVELAEFPGFSLFCDAVTYEIKAAQPDERRPATGTAQLSVRLPRRIPGPNPFPPLGGITAKFLRWSDSGEMALVGPVDGAVWKTIKMWTSDIQEAAAELEVKVPAMARRRRKKLVGVVLEYKASDELEVDLRPGESPVARGVPQSKANVPEKCSAEWREDGKTAVFCAELAANENLTITAEQSTFTQPVSVQDVKIGK